MAAETLGNLSRLAARYRLDHLAVFSAAAAVFAWTQWCPTFADPDSFYHAKIAGLMLAGGPVRYFPWLPFSSLATAFADHHFLYHAALAPFVAVFGGLPGTKIAAVVFAALAITAFYAALRAYAVRLPAVFALAAATCGVFMFRITLAKAAAPALIIVFLTLIAWRRSRPVWLFILSWLFVWTHGAWPITVVIAAAFLATRLFVRHKTEDLRPKPSSPVSRLWSPVSRLWSSVPELRCAFAVLAGLAAGLIINPFFPYNLYFYWQQIFQIAVVNYYGQVNIGTEWYPYTLAELFRNAAAVFLVLAVEVGLMCAVMFWGRTGTVRREELRPRPEERAGFAAIAVLAVFFLAMALRQRRHAEYFVPFAFFAEALLLTGLWPFLTELFRRARNSGDRWLHLGVGLFFAYLIMFFPLLAARDAWHIQMINNVGRPWTKLERAADWLRANLPEGETVFISDWSDFPPLFYRDDTHRYVIGLDPTFLYLYDQEKYRRYDDIVTGRLGAPGALISRTFGARAAVVERENEALVNGLLSDHRARAVYEDDEVIVFSLF